jgi:hypothetical protein
LSIRFVVVAVFLFFLFLSCTYIWYTYMRHVSVWRSVNDHAMALWHAEISTKFDRLLAKQSPTTCFHADILRFVILYLFIFFLSLSLFLCGH